MGLIGKVSALAVVVAAALLYLLLPLENDASFVESLKQIETIHYTELTPKDFRKSFVLSGKPVILDFTLRGEASSNAAPPFDMGDLERLCGDQQVSLMSGPTATTARALKRAPLLKMAFLALFGESIESWEARLTKRISIAEFVRQMRMGAGRTARVPMPVLARLVSAISSYIAKIVDSIAVIYLSPPYLADQSIIFLCPALLRHPAVLRARKLQAELREAAWLAKLAAHIDRASGRRPRNLSDVVPLPGDMYTKLFVGGPFSISYPLHRDHANGDVLTYMLTGCKEIVLLSDGREGEGLDDYVERRRLDGTTAYGIDVFSHRAPPAGVEGFRGTLNPGQMIFFPADMRHAIRNRCPDSVALTDRPWRTNVVHEVVLHVVENTDSGGDLDEMLDRIIDA